MASSRSLPRPASPPRVTVIVPVHNGGEGFRRCLEAIAAADPPPAELIVVADGDTDGSRKLARSAGATVLERATPGGPAVARNLGAHAATGDILFFLDADVEVARDAIGRVQAAFAADAELVALIGSYDDAPGEPDFLSQYKNLLHHHTHQTARSVAFTFWGACGAIRRELFLAAGGFDQSYTRPSIEDIELGYRLARAGHKLRLDKELQVKHLKRWDALTLLRTDFFARALPWTELIHREGRIPNDLNLSLGSRLSVVAVYGLGGSLLLALRWPRALALGLLAAGSLLALNAPVYRFLLRKRGAAFALRALPWHWLYYAYSGAAFVIGTVRVGVGRRAQRRSAAPLERASR